MAKERLFDLPVTKGQFQIRGNVLGCESEKFYKSGSTKNGNDFRSIHFGVKYDENATVYMDLFSTAREKVYFYKKDSETKAVNWANRNNFHEEGYSPIGVNCGLEQKRDENGKVYNVSKRLVEFDACEYMNAYLDDGLSVFAGGNIEFSSFADNNGNVTRKINFRPTQISACLSPIDFDSEKFVPKNDFKQMIVFREITQEKDGDKPTGRFIVSAYIVNYGSIENANFIVEDKAGATYMKKTLREYDAVTIWGNVVSRVIVEEIESNNGWGTPDPTKRISRPVVTEMIITGGDWDNIDKETYTEKEMNKALDAIRKSKNAEKNFADSDDSDTSGWGSSSGIEDDEDTPW